MERTSAPKAKTLLGASRACLFVALYFAAGCATSEKHINREIPHLYSVSDPQFVQTMSSLLGPGFVKDNRFTTLLNGDEIFPAMLSAIEGARQNVNFETYIYWSGVTGKQFASALGERARSGVNVHVLIDCLGSDKMDPDSIAAMESAGVKITRFHCLHWYNLHRLNNRTHRKLLIVDGRIGFTGGVGIADPWTGNAQDPEHWRDSHYRVEGPVVTQMQAVFMDNWIKATGEVLHGVDYFPVVPPVAGGAAQMFSSSPSGGGESMKLMFLLAITAAERSIYLSSAYFVPDEMARKALVGAVRRGVKVQIITAGEHIDVDTVRRASRARWGDLLEAGVEIFEYQPTMYHCKMMVVDERFVSVGSTNFDPRSFSLNDEANLNIVDTEFARQQIEVFRRDLSLSRQITFAQWRERPLVEKLVDHAASLLGPQL